MLSIRIDNEQQTLKHRHQTGQLVLGREPLENERGLVIDDAYVSRRHLLIESVTPGGIKMTNLGRNAVRLADGRQIDHGTTGETALPTRMTVGHTTIVMHWEADSATIDTEELALETIQVPRPIGSPRLSKLGDSPPPEQLLEWLETLLSMQRSAAGSVEFYQETAQAMVDLIGLNRGMVVLRQDGHWKVVAAAIEAGRDTLPFSKTVLEMVLQQKNTVYGCPHDLSAAASISRLETVVGAPIFDGKQDVAGMLFGSRDMAMGSPEHSEVSQLEATVVKLLAASVTTAVERQRVQQMAAVGQALGFIMHDLRGPLGNARQLIELLRSDSDVGMSREEHLSYIEDALQVSEQLLNDSLEFCRGRVQLRLQHGTFHNLLDKHLRLLAITLEGFKIPLRLELDDDTPICFDPDRIARVLRNLAKNAAEALYQKADAEITIGGMAATSGVELWVADNGPGLPAEVQSRLFQPFATHGKRGGTGFGLAIAKQLVEAHDGTIRVESDGRGTRFVMWIPLPKPRDLPQPTAPSESRHAPSDIENTVPGEPRSLNVLLAEDGLVNQKMIQHVLQRAGHQVTTVADGRRAVNALSEDAFDVVLMDIEMPVLDGLSACREIRSGDTSSRNTPIIALSAHDSDEIRHRCREAGIDRYLTKPVNIDRLQLCLNEMTRDDSPS